MRQERQMRWGDGRGRSKDLACTGGFSGEGECRQGSRDLHNDKGVSNGSRVRDKESVKCVHQALSLRRQGSVGLRDARRGRGSRRTLRQRLRTMNLRGEGETLDSSRPRSKQPFSYSLSALPASPSLIRQPKRDAGHATVTLSPSVPVIPSSSCELEPERPLSYSHCN